MTQEILCMIHNGNNTRKTLWSYVQQIHFSTGKQQHCLFFSDPLELALYIDCQNWNEWQ